MADRKAEDDPIQKHIDQNLRRIFDETANEPLPDQLAMLLQQLQEQETRK